MRLTCLRCGNQMEVAVGGPPVAMICTCGVEISYPEVYNTGVRPNERAAERSRYRAFRAAGLVKNMGGFALGLALLGLPFFPFGVLGAAVGIYVLTMLRGPMGRYSGRKQAMAAIAVGVTTFMAQSVFWYSYLQGKSAERLAGLQASASEDLRALLRTQRLFRAAQDRFGNFKDFKFQPRTGAYTIYLSNDDWFPATRDEQSITDPLPPEWAPSVSAAEFMAVAVANLDGDAELDVWVLNDRGDVRQVANDITGEVSPPPPKPAPPPPAPVPADSAPKTEPAKVPKQDLPKVAPATGDAAAPVSPPPPAVEEKLVDPNEPDLLNP